MTAPYCTHEGCHDARTNLYGRNVDGGTVSVESLWPDARELAWLAGRSVVEPVRLCWVHAKLAGFSPLREGPPHVCRPPAAQIFRGSAPWRCADCGRVWVRCGGGWESRGSAAG